MRNIFLFIRRYFNFFLFLFLQVLCIYFIVNYSRYHHAAFAHTANKLTGSVNKQYNNVEDYFHLKRINDSLLLANERLYNMLKQNYNLPDTVTRQSVDSIKLDSSSTLKNYSYLSAKIIANSVASQSNSLVLFGSNVLQAHKDMGVVDELNAVVGVITDISGEYAVVMSLLHKDSRLNGKLLKTGETGTILWDGKETNVVTMLNIPKTTRISKGDSVITSGFSTRFPKGLLVGRVEEVLKDKTSNNFIIKLRTAVNFHNVQYGYILANKQQLVVNDLLEKNKLQQQ